MLMRMPTRRLRLHPRTTARVVTNALQPARAPARERPAAASARRRSTRRSRSPRRARKCSKPRASRATSCDRTCQASAKNRVGTRAGSRRAMRCPQNRGRARPRTPTPGDRSRPHRRSCTWPRCRRRAGEADPEREKLIGQGVQQHAQPRPAAGPQAADDLARGVAGHHRWRIVSSERLWAHAQLVELVGVLLTSRRKSSTSDGAVVRSDGRRATRADTAERGTGAVPLSSRHTRSITRSRRRVSRSSASTI